MESRDDLTPEGLGHISDWFWDIVHRAEKSRPKLRELLTNMTKEEVYRFQKEFVEASVELQTEPFIDYMAESEDGVEDVSHWVVSQGKSYYLRVWSRPEIVPAEVEENDPEILYGVAAEVYRERFGESIGVYG